jgi:hypothetical protein
MRSNEVFFDGHRLNDLFGIGIIDAQPPSFEPNLLSRPRGSMLRGRRYGDGSISVALVAKRGRGRSVECSTGELLSWLDVDGARMLTLPSDDGRRRLVVPTGVSVDDPEWGDRLTVSFEQVDPYLYGETRTATMSSSATSVTLSVGGTAPTRPTVTCQMAYGAPSSLRVWQLTDEDGDKVALVLPDGSTHAVTIDCAARSAAIDGAPTTITLESDWLELAPGEHTLRRTVGQVGSSTRISWVERWHR